MDILKDIWLVREMNEQVERYMDKRDLDSQREMYG